jgi:Protein of unknown function (DUF3370)
MLRRTCLALACAAALPLVAQAAVTWSAGTLASNQKVADNLLQPLSVAYGGYPIWKSNNPEIFRGTGWLMQNARTDASRGGRSYPLSGCHNAYLFHINQRGAGAYLHLVATNPNNATITVSAKGSMYTNSQKPLTGRAAGPGYAVSQDWLGGTFGTNFSGRSVGAFQGTEIAKLPMSNSNMLDGRFEVCASQPIYLYSVVTSSGSSTDAINLTQGAPATGDIKSETANTYGREAGVYANSLIAGTTVVDLPANGNVHAGFALNTSAKFNANLQEQTVPALFRLGDASTRSYGNYGHKVDVTLRLRNPHSAGKTVRVSLGSSFTNTVNTPSFTFNSAGSVNGTPVSLWTTPTQPKQLLGSYTVPANGTVDVRLTTFIAGLGVTNQQLVVEVR